LKRADSADRSGSTPVVEDGAIYGMARDVSDRRRAEAEVERLADEHAALRRVATLVAEAPPLDDVFDAVSREAGELLGADFSEIARFDGERVVTIATWAAAGPHPPVPDSWPMQPDDLATSIVQTGEPTRWEDWTDVPGPIAAFIRDELGVHCSAGCPIMVNGELWGLIMASWKGDQSPPPDTEARMVKFAGLLDTAIAKFDAREALNQVAEEQAALRRVATMVAGGSSPEAVFVQVAEEVGRLLRVDAAAIQRYDPDGYATVVGNWGTLGDAFRIGARLKLDGDSIIALVYRTAQPVRVDSYERATGSAVARAREVGLRSGAGSPIVVDGRLWGAMGIATSREEPVPLGAEWRVAQFTELVAMAISNIQARSDLAASQARVVATADEGRRRVVRDLHDGAQQRIVQMVVTLELAKRAFQEIEGEAAALVDEALEQAQQAHEELRELAHGILPAVLTHGGLRAGVDSVVRRLDLPVQVDIPAERFQADTEASAYFIVAEALTNVVKHAHATRAEVTASVEDGTLHLQVRDDGIGGADPDGHGLVGMSDRVTALGGRLKIESPASGGTLVAATLRLSAG
jgi:signal transduction histidine kinase